MLENQIGFNILEIYFSRPVATLISFYSLLFPKCCPARSITSSSTLAFVKVDMFLAKTSSNTLEGFL